MNKPVVDVQKDNERIANEGVRSLADLLRAASGKVEQYGRIGLDLTIHGGKIIAYRTIDERTVQTARKPKPA